VPPRNDDPLNETGGFDNGGSAAIIKPFSTNALRHCEEEERRRSNPLLLVSMRFTTKQNLVACVNVFYDEATPCYLFQ